MSHYAEQRDKWDEAHAIREPKRIVLSSFHETRFGLWALDANGQVYEVSNEMDGERPFPNHTGRFVLTMVAFVDPKEGK